MFGSGLTHRFVLAHGIGLMDVNPNLTLICSMRLTCLSYTQCNITGHVQYLDTALCCVTVIM